MAILPSEEDMNIGGPSLKAFAVMSISRTHLGRVMGRCPKDAKSHTVAEDTVYISGEIPPVTEYEQDLLGAVR